MVRSAPHKMKLLGEAKALGTGSGSGIGNVSGTGGSTSTSTSSSPTVTSSTSSPSSAQANNSKSNSNNNNNASSAAAMNRKRKANTKANSNSTTNNTNNAAADPIAVRSSKRSRHSFIPYQSPESIDSILKITEALSEQFSSKPTTTNTTKTNSSSNGTATAIGGAKGKKQQSKRKTDAETNGARTSTSTDATSTVDSTSAQSSNAAKTSVKNAAAKNPVKKKGVDSNNLAKGKKAPTKSAAATLKQRSKALVNKSIKKVTTAAQQKKASKVKKSITDTNEKAKKAVKGVASVTNGLSPAPVTPAVKKGKKKPDAVDQSQNQIQGQSSTDTGVAVVKVARKRVKKAVAPDSTTGLDIDLGPTSIDLGPPKKKKVKAKGQSSTSVNINQPVTSLSPNQKVIKIAKRRRKGAVLTPRPHIPIYELDPTFEQKLVVPPISTIADSRLIIRAVLLKDDKLLSTLLAEQSKRNKLQQAQQQQQQSGGKAGASKEKEKAKDNKSKSSASNSPAHSICSLCIPRSLDISKDAFAYALQSHNLSALKLLTDEKLLASTEFAPFPELMLQKESTGHGNAMMFGHGLRQVTVGRGGKEGNNAFLKDSRMYGGNFPYRSLNNDLADAAMTYGVPFSKLETLANLQGNNNNNVSTFLSRCCDNVIEAIRRGHRELAGLVIKDANAKGGFGFNLLHEEVLLKMEGDELTPFKSVSIVKKATNNCRITPLHCACINPNVSILKKLLFASDSVHELTAVLDTSSWSVLHYAAACQGAGPLKFLLSRSGGGMSTLSVNVNKEGNTPLHIAAQLGRVENVRVILEHELEFSKAVVTEKGGENMEEEGEKAPIRKPTALSKINKKGLSPLHVAAAHFDAAGSPEIVQMMLNAWDEINRDSATPPTVDPINKSTAAQFDKLSPLMIACQQGHLALVKWLCGDEERREGLGVKLELQDRRGRTALFHAVMNGHAHIVSYLLRLGVNAAAKDSSGNTLLHYAAAYGWYFNLRLLMDAGCSITEMNQWKVTPLAVAFMKGHNGLVEFILQQPGIDINSPINDSTGVTLLLETCTGQPSQNMLDRIKFLLEEQGADPKITDFGKNSALHKLVEVEGENLKSETRWNNYESTPKQKCLFRAAELLISKGCDPSAVNSQKVSPYTLAVSKGCFSFLSEVFIPAKKDGSNSNGIIPTAVDNNGNTLLHTLLNFSVANKSVETFYKKILKSHPSNLGLLKKMAQTHNDKGETPLLKLVAYMSAGRSSWNNDPRLALETPEEVQRTIEFLRFLVEDLNSNVQAMSKTKSKTKPKPAPKQERKPKRRSENGDRSGSESDNSSSESEEEEQEESENENEDEKQDESDAAQHFQSVLHLAVETDSRILNQVFKILLSRKPNLEVLNSDGQTPLAKAVWLKRHDSVQLLVESGANVNVKVNNSNKKTTSEDKSQVTKSLLIHLCENPVDHSFNLVRLFIEKGATVLSDVDPLSGNSALHFIALKPNLPFASESTRKIIEKASEKFNVKQTVCRPNKLGRTALHLLVNSRGGETDVSYDLEDILIAAAPETLVSTDHRGRTPLHYCFQKIGKFRDGSFMDPIELTAILVGAFKEREKVTSPRGYSQVVAQYIRKPDEFGDSALHYAAARGATISCSFLLAECEAPGQTLSQSQNQNQSSLIDTPDKRGNTPFGLAVLNGHEGCALQFQQKKGNFTLTLNCDRSVAENKNNNTSPNNGSSSNNNNGLSWKWKKIVREEQEKKKKLAREQIYTILEQVVRKDWQGILHLMHESLKNSSVNSNTAGGLSSGIYAAIKTLRYKLALKLIARVKKVEELLIASNNSNNKNNNEGTLLHILAKYSSSNDSTKHDGDTSSGSSNDSQIEIVQRLISKGLDVLTVDEHKSTALIYAAISRNLSLCLQLAEEMKKARGASPSQLFVQPDSMGRTPFSAIFWNLSESTKLSDEWKNWIKTSLIGPGNFNNIKADRLSEFPLRLSEFPGDRFLRLENAGGPSSSILPICRFTPLIVAVITGNYEVVKWLIVQCKGQVDINAVDELGRTPIMHACRLNDIKMVKLLLNPSKYEPQLDNIPWDTAALNSFSHNNSQLNFSIRDKSGFTLIDHLISPSPDKIPSFCYEKASLILKLLHNKGKANLPLQASLGEKSPLDRALFLNRAQLSAAIQDLQGIPKARQVKVPIEYEDFVKIPRPSSAESGGQNGPVVTDFVQDARAMATKLIAEQEEREKAKNKGNVPRFLSKPDSLIGSEAKSLTVVVDESLDTPFDCVLTKVDLSYGIHGLYNFYKMQLLRKETQNKSSNSGGESSESNTENSDLILLFTRWGRVGDNGQYQKTPFANLEEATKEFKKIFKAKSGNEWGAEFIPMPKRYRLVNKDLQSRNQKKLNQAQVDFSILEKSGREKSPSPLIPREDQKYELIKDLSLLHQSSYGHMPASYDGCQELPFSSLSTETLSRGDEILQKIEKVLQEKAKLNDPHQPSASTSTSTSAKTEELKKEAEMKIMNSLVELSEEFYAIIPVYGFASEKLTPIFSQEELRSKQQVIYNILHLEFASTLLLSAQFNVGRMNPFEYIYRCLGGTRLQAMQSAEEESQLILQYVHNTAGSGRHSKATIQNVFRIERPGELEWIQESGIGNRTLLWHGTKAVNLLSILNKGLQVAPIGAQISGHLFGKGIYFADMFEKSQKYCEASDKYFYALVCEVALGKTFPVSLGYNPLQNSETPQAKLPAGFHTVQTSDSQYEPDPGTTIHYKGRSIPLGKQTTKVLKKDCYYGLDFNEYIVFNPKQVCLRYLVQFKV